MTENYNKLIQLVTSINETLDNLRIEIKNDKINENARARHNCLISAVFGLFDTFRIEYNTDKAKMIKFDKYISRINNDHMLIEKYENKSCFVVYTKQSDQETIFSEFISRTNELYNSYLDCYNDKLDIRKYFEVLNTIDNNSVDMKKAKADFTRSYIFWLLLSIVHKWNNKLKTIGVLREISGYMNGKYNVIGLFNNICDLYYDVQRMVNTIRNFENDGALIIRLLIEDIKYFKNGE